jgi:transcriptional regulator with XRE-family HTH domain
MKSMNNEFSSLFETLWEDETTRFEAKAQDVAIALASAVERAGLSRAQLAKKLDWKPSRVTKVLTGSSNLTLKTIFEVCHAVGLEFDVVLREASEQTEIIDPSKHQAVHREAMNNLHRSRQLLELAAQMHRKVSQNALATRHFTHEKCRLKLVA